MPTRFVAPPAMGFVHFWIWPNGNRYDRGKEDESMRSGQRVSSVCPADGMSGP